MRHVLFVLGLCLAGCSAPPPECAAIAQRCSPHIAEGHATSAQMDCYDNARNVWTVSQCIDNLSRCQAACLPLTGDGGM